jgi:hypothetical protein
VPSPTPALPAFATADGVIRGTSAGLVVDPTADVAPADAVAFTTAARVVDVGPGTGTVFSPRDAVVSVGSGRRHRPVVSVAVTDLGGVVSEVVRLSPQATALVVLARAVDDRGRPLRSTPAVVYVGDLVTGRPPEHAGDQEIADTLDLLLGLLGADDVVVSGEGAVLARTDVEDDRAARQQVLYSAPSLAEQAQRTLPLA